MTNAPIIDGLLHQAGESIAFQVGRGIRDAVHCYVPFGARCVQHRSGSIAYSDLGSGKRNSFVIRTETRNSWRWITIDLGFVRTRGWGKAENEKVEGAFQRFFEFGFSPVSFHIH